MICLRRGGEEERRGEEEIGGGEKRRGGEEERRRGENRRGVPLITVSVFTNRVVHNLGVRSSEKERETKRVRALPTHGAVR